MQTRIGKFVCRYRVYGAGAGGSAAAAGSVGHGPEDVVRRDAVAAFGEAMDGALGDDPTVYVIRRLSVAAVLHRHAGSSEPAGRRVARTWVRAVGRTLAHGMRGTDVITFDGQADFVASFVRDLVRGDAWGRWEYGAFRKHDARATTGEAVLDALLDNKDHLPRVLALLWLQNVLDEVLDRLSPVQVSTLWRQGLGAAAGARPGAHRPMAEDDLAALWPIVRAAATVLAELSGSPASVVDETVLRDYAATRPARPDWGEARALSAAVLDAVRFLVRRSPATTSRGGTPVVADPSLSWLDLPWLSERVTELLQRRATADTRRGAPRLIALTPRHRELFRDLAEALRRGGVYLSPDDAGGAGYALRLYGMLVAHAPRWGEAAYAPTLIGRLLNALHATSGRAGGAARARGLGAIPPDRARGEAGTPPDRDLALLKLAFDAAPELARRTLPDTARTGSRGTPPAETFASPAAAIFLLARAVTDARLAALVGRGGFGGAGRVGGGGAAAAAAAAAFADTLAMLAVRWSGLMHAGADERIDPAVRCFAGPHCVASVGEVWARLARAPVEACGEFQRLLAEHLIQARIADSSRCQVLVLSGGGRPDVLALTDAAGLTCLRAVPLPPSAQACAAVIAQWSGDLMDGSSPAAPFDVDPELRAALGALAQRPSSTSALAMIADPSPQRSRWRAAFDLLCRPTDAVTPDVDVTLAVAASGVLRMWGRWLRGLSRSSDAYLLEQFVGARSGELRVSDREVVVRLDPRPLDVVLEMSGYLDEYDGAHWIGGARKVRFER